MVTRRFECYREPSTVFKVRSARRSDKRTLKNFRHLVLLPLVLFLISCAAAETIRKPLPREGRSEVEVYLQPVPAQARRVQWTIGDLTAIRKDGVRFPLTLRPGYLKDPDLGNRQIHLASGFLPPGTYSGLSVTISEATLPREDGDAALMVPEEPILLTRDFELSLSQVLPLFLSLESADLVAGGSRFSPSFALALPSRELTSLTGYMAIPEADRITIFNRKTLRVTNTLATGRSPTALSLDPVRGRAYVAASGDHSIQVIDVLDGVIRERIPLRGGDKPVDLALTRDGQVLLSANYGSGTVSVMDPVQGVVLERIAVGRGPTSVTVNRTGTRAYVTCSLSGSVSIVDLSTGNLSASLIIETAMPLDAVLDREEERLFVISRDSTDLTVVDTSSLAVTDRIYVGPGSTSLLADDISGFVLVGRSTSQEISVIDPSAPMPVDTIALMGAAGHMTLDHQDNTLLVVIPGSGVLQKIDLVSKRVLAEMETKLVPSEVAVFE